jgi:hypothetical protein
MDTASLLAEIRRVFPPVPMPNLHDLRFHPAGCVQCQWLSEYLDENRGKPIDGPIIRYMHQELGCLSAKGWVWALPHYLPFCLTAEAAYNQMETEFLIYNLGPAEEYEAETRLRLSTLNSDQVGCLIRFLKWCEAHPHWSEYCPENISSALQFVGTIKA